LNDEQALIYGDYAASTGAPYVYLRWLYFKKHQAVLAQELEEYIAAGGADAEYIEKQKRGIARAPHRASAKPSDLCAAPRELRGGVERVILPVVDQIVKWRGRLTDPLTAPPNPDHCDAFGGCEWRPHCKVTTQQIASAIFGGDDMASIWDKIQINGPTLTQPAPAETPAAAPGFNFNIAAPAPAPAPAPAQATAPLDNAKIAQRLEERLPLHMQADAAPSGLGDPLVRIGRALIAAGRVLAGE
jgi:hypothetical protein